MPAFANVQITSARQGLYYTTGYREDLRPGEFMLLTLTGTTAGITTHKWRILGAPEGSAAQAYPANSYFSTFYVDADTLLLPKDGSYLISCLVNEGLPTETDIRTVLVRPSPYSDSTGRRLRIPAPGESLENRTDPAGYAKQVNRWYKLAEGGSDYGAGLDASEHYISPDLLGAFTGPNPNFIKGAGGQLVHGSVGGYARTIPMPNCITALPYIVPQQSRLEQLLTSLTNVSANHPQIGLAVYANDAYAGCLYPGTKLFSYYWGAAPAFAGITNVTTTLPAGGILFPGNTLIWLASWFDPTFFNDSVGVVISDTYDLFPMLGADVRAAMPLPSPGWLFNMNWPAYPPASDPWPDPFPTTATAITAGNMAWTPQVFTQWL